VQKYLHDMDAWNALPVEEQEKVIGRTKLSDIEMPDDVKPANSHVALNTIEDPDGTERQILRANMPFGELGGGEFGTYYIAYAATPSVTEQMLVNMFIGNPPGNYDRILGFLHGGHRQPVLRAVGRLPRRPPGSAGGAGPCP
jgi:putative iron-dependent peroxidase